MRASLPLLDNCQNEFVIAVKRNKFVLASCVRMDDSEDDPLLTDSEELGGDSDDDAFDLDDILTNSDDEYPGESRRDHSPALV